jgi:hypothetical protein
MPWAAIAGLTAAGALGGALSNRKSARTSTQEWSQSGTESGSSTATRVLTPEQQAAMRMVSQQNMQSAANPFAAVDPMRMYARSHVNANYAGAEDAIAARYGTSGAKSGKAGTAGRMVEMARIGQLSGVDRDAAEMALGERNRALQELMQLLGMAFETQQNFSGTRSASGTGTSVGPGDPWGGMLAGGAGALLGGLGAKYGKK